MKHSILKQTCWATAASLLLFTGSRASATSAIYTDKAQFLAASGAGPLSLNQFNDLNYGAPTGPLNYAIGSNPAYSISSPPELGAFAVYGAVSALDNGLDPSLRIDVLGGATAIGANFYGTDAVGTFSPASLRVNLSDGTSQTILAGNTTAFLGFVSGGPLITSLQIHNPNFGVDGLYPTMDNLYVVYVVGPPPPFTYTTNSGALTITGYTGSGGAVTIPSMVNGLPVTRIGDSAFQGTTNLTSVAIPNSVTSIGNWAFYNCSGLTSVAIPNSVTSIGSYAFYSCSGLTSVTIPDSVTSIGDGAFFGCSGLTALNVDPLNGYYSSLDGVLFNKAQSLLIRCPARKTGGYTVPNSVTSIGNSAFSACYGLTSVTIPNSVTNIGSYAFSYCSGLTSVAIPNSVPNIGNYTFQYCSGLTSVTIPNSVTNIGSFAFSFCSGLTNLDLGGGVTSIGLRAFSDCGGLVSVTIPATVRSVSGPFAYCTNLLAIAVSPANTAFRSVSGVMFSADQSLLVQYPGGKAGSYQIPATVTSIGSRGFAGCHRLVNVTIPVSVTSIGDFVFFACHGLTAFNVDPLNGSYSSPGGILFDKAQSLLIQSPCGMSGSYIIPNSVTNIGSGAFGYCSGLTSVTLGNNVTSIGQQAFYSCSGLTSVTIGNSVTSIGSDAFQYCSKLQSAFFLGNAPYDDSSVFTGCTNVCYYLAGTIGWGATYAGRPAYLWNPAPQTTGPNFGVRTNRFGFDITGTAGIPIVVEATTNLTGGSWVPLQTCTLTNGSSYFSDSDWSSFPTRFYRVRSP